MFAFVILYLNIAELLSTQPLLSKIPKSSGLFPLLTFSGQSIGNTLFCPEYSDLILDYFRKAIVNNWDSSKKILRQQFLDKSSPLRYLRLLLHGWQSAATRSKNVSTVMGSGALCPVHRRHLPATRVNWHSGTSDTHHRGPCGPLHDTPPHRTRRGDAAGSVSGIPLPGTNPSASDFHSPNTQSQQC